MFRLASILVFAVAFPAVASRVEKISPKGSLALISDVDTTTLKVNDSICLSREVKTQVCGLIVQVKERTIVFSPADKKHNLIPGDIASVQATTQKFAPNDRDPSGIKLEITGSRPRRLRDTHLLVAGANLIQPVLRFEQAIGKHLSLGIMPTFLILPIQDDLGASGMVTGWGAMGTFSFYLKRPYRGFYFLGGVGFSFINASVGAEKGNTATVTALGTIGYRWALGPTFNFGLAAGGQYLSNGTTATTSLTIAFPTFVPAGFAELGVSF